MKGRPVREARRRRKIFYGWWIVLAGAILRFFESATFFYGFTLFFNPIRNTFGWTAAVTSIAFTLQRLEWGILGPIAGFLADRVGPRKLIFFGWSLAGLGFLLMSRINSLWAFYGFILLISMGTSLGALLPVTTAIANWFTKKRSRAMTFVYTGSGVSGIFIPLLALSISQFGWRETLIIVGIGLWVITLPLSLVMRHKPSQYGYLPDGEIRASTSELTNVPGLHSSNGAGQDSDSVATGFTVKEALRTRAFWLIALCFLFQYVGTSAVFVHIVPYLESVNVPTAISATAVMGMTLCSLIGRLGFGFLGDFISKRYLMVIACTLQALGLFIFSFIDMDRAWLLIPFLLIYGSGYGAPYPLRSALQADYFGTRSFGTIMGAMAPIGMLGGLSSPIIAGWIFDVLGSYRLAWLIFAMVTVPAAPLMLLAKPPRARQEPSQNALRPYQ